MERNSFDGKEINDHKFKCIFINQCLNKSFKKKYYKKIDYISINDTHIQSYI